MPPQPPPEPEFSRPVPVAELDADGLSLEVAAEAGECEALARRFDLVALRSLSARIRLAARGTGDGRRITVAGELEAVVVQRCVISLKSVESALRDRFEVVFAPPIGEPRPREQSFTVDDPDPPEPLIGDRIDIGELVAEHLALALDPYPRHPDAELPAEILRAAANADRTERDAEQNPFAALQTLRPAKKD